MLNSNLQIESLIYRHYNGWSSSGMPANPVTKQVARQPWGKVPIFTSTGYGFNGLNLPDKDRNHKRDKKHGKDGCDQNGDCRFFGLYA